MKMNNHVLRSLVLGCLVALSSELTAAPSPIHVTYLKVPSTLSVQNDFASLFTYGGMFGLLDAVRSEGQADIQVDWEKRQTVISAGTQHLVLPLKDDRPLTKKITVRDYDDPYPTDLVLVATPLQIYAPTSKNLEDLIAAGIAGKPIHCEIREWTMRFYRPLTDSDRDARHLLQYSPDGAPIGQPVSCAY